MRRTTLIDEDAIVWSHRPAARAGWPLIVFLHGFSGAEHDWAAWFSSLPREVAGASLRAPVAVGDPKAGSVRLSGGRGWLRRQHRTSCRHGRHPAVRLVWHGWPRRCHHTRHGDQVMAVAGCSHHRDDRRPSRRRPSAEFHARRRRHCLHRCHTPRRAVRDCRFAKGRSRARPWCDMPGGSPRNAPAVRWSGAFGRFTGQFCETGHTMRRRALQWNEVAGSHCVRQRARWRSGRVTTRVWARPPVPPRWMPPRAVRGMRRAEGRRGGPGASGVGPVGRRALVL